MGKVLDMDAELCGTTDPPRLALLVKLLEKRSDLNTPALSRKLAAAKRLLEKIDAQT